MQQTSRLNIEHREQCGSLTTSHVMCYEQHSRASGQATQQCVLHTHTHTHMHTHTHTHTHTHAHTHTHTHTHAHMHTHTHMHTHRNSHSHIYTHACRYAHIHKHIVHFRRTDSVQLRSNIIYQLIVGHFVHVGLLQLCLKLYCMQLMKACMAEMPYNQILTATHVIAHNQYCLY